MSSIEAFEPADAVNLLRDAIRSLQLSIGPDELERRRREMLALVDMLDRGPSLREAGTGEDDHRYGRLSPREREILEMMLAGQRLKEIAANLDISVKTVTTHRSRLMRKLGISDNLGLYRYGIVRGLIAL
jgi:DNA-binding CsgD family transcriptional regulator